MVTSREERQVTKASSKVRKTPAEAPTPAPPIDIPMRYQAAKEVLLQTRVHQFEYGKWLLASLLAVHGGSLIAISQAGDVRAQLYEASGPSLIYGLAAALIAGGMGWFNFTFASQVYDTRIGALKDGLPLPQTPKMILAVTVTMWAAVILAVTSLTLFVLAAHGAIVALKPEKIEFWYNTETTSDDPNP
jgi:hypothetical protein